MYRSNGLIDDFVVYGTAKDYVHFSNAVKEAVSSSKPVVLATDSSFNIQVSKDSEFDKLFTSLQSEGNQYFSHKDWENRNILRVIGSELVLEKLHKFLHNLSYHGEGYSYISEYSEPNHYSSYSPEWWLCVEKT